MDTRIAGLILAGGLSRRMGGGDKALIDIGGTTLLARIAGRLAPQVSALAISANGDAERFAATGLPVLPDCIPGHIGPLAGVLTGLDWAASQGVNRVVTVASDTPLLPEDLVARLANAAAPLAAASSAGRVHPVFALWDVALAVPLRQMLETGERRMMAALLALGAVTVEWPAEPVDPFFNANTPADVEALREMLG
ncbi:MAG: molybdenum cofactor guanylyltransferase MobA [Solirubrobacterales bacterium]